MRYVLSSLIMVMLVLSSDAALLAASPDQGQDPHRDRRLSRSQRELARRVRAINRARSPRSAIRAYARGLRVVEASPALHRAYLRRMVDFGVPEIAGPAAERLAELDPKDGLAWGVVGYMAARQGQVDQAVSALLKATKYLPDEPFILQTAGNLIAWVDTAGDRTEIQPAVQDDLKRLRRALGNKPAYERVYRKARDLHAEAADEPAEHKPARRRRARRQSRSVDHPSVARGGGLNADFGVILNTTGDGVFQQNFTEFSPVIIVPPTTSTGRGRATVRGLIADPQKRNRLIQRLVRDFQKQVVDRRLPAVAQSARASGNRAPIFGRPMGVAPAMPRGFRPPMGTPPPLRGGIPAAPRGFRPPMGVAPPLRGGIPAAPRGFRPPMGVAPPMVGAAPARPGN